MQVPTSAQIVAFGPRLPSSSRITSKGWMSSPGVSGIVNGAGAGTVARRGDCGDRPAFSDSTNARLDVVIPTDVPTNRPNADGSGSTWTTLACNPCQRGENERVTRPSNATPTAINRSHGAPKR